MTHDELLDRIAQEGLKPYGNVMNTNLVLALRAVVELHKPNPEGDECSYCGWECGGELVSFPCDTIKTIEKELG
jgi:hypothetical protein